MSLGRVILCVLVLLILLLLALALAGAGRPRGLALGGELDGALDGLGGLDDGGEGPDWVTGGAGFRLRMRDPGYTQALNGQKTIEARPNRPPFDKLKAGDSITVARSRAQGDTSEYEGARRFPARVERVTPYDSLKALIAAEGLKAVWPGAKSEAAAAAAFREFTDEAAEKAHGLVAIAFKREDH